MCMADTTEGILTYNTETSRFEFYGDSPVHNERSFYRGSAMEIYLYHEWRPTRIEHNGTEWYLVGTGLAGTSLERQKIRVKSINGFLLFY